MYCKCQQSHGSVRRTVEIHWNVFIKAAAKSGKVNSVNKDAEGVDNAQGRTKRVKGEIRAGCDGIKEEIIVVLEDETS